MIGKNGVSLVALAGSLAMVSAPALAQTTTTDDTNIGQSPQEAATKAATYHFAAKGSIPLFLMASCAFADFRKAIN